MKKFFIIVSVILSSLMLFAVVGCNDNENKNEETKSQSTICGLEEAYAEGLISKDDLRSIAYYYNGEDAESDFVPPPKTPETLNENTISKIKQAYYDKVSDGHSTATVDDVNIGGYYGAYNGCVIVIISASCTSGIGGDPRYYPEYEIDGVVFYWYTPLQVWQETVQQTIS